MVCAEGWLSTLTVKECPSGAVFKSVVKPFQKSGVFNESWVAVKGTTWGCEHESDAIQRVKLWSSLDHQQFSSNCNCNCNCSLSRIVMVIVISCLVNKEGAESPTSAPIERVFSHTLHIVAIF